MIIDFNKIDIEDVGSYLSEVNDEFFDKRGICNYIANELEQYEDLSWLVDICQDLDGNGNCYKIDNGYPVAMSNKEIEEEFENYMDEIIERTDIKEDYPNLFNDIEI